MDDTALPELFDTKKLQKPKFSIPPLQKKDRSGSAVFRTWLQFLSKLVLQEQTLFLRFLLAFSLI